ncbi:hypothetical protein L2E82_28123 [Cichorium intybus]|uniref:Uncharacterized protein n=1 Tax=Cichorium intybus TaxID=13427 RepID=A0ACB9CUV5_CICIN|nr:hypothetical protein L2E82_28123 [Cichorium intybus]
METDDPFFRTHRDVQPIPVRLESSQDHQSGRYIPYFRKVKISDSSWTMSTLTTSLVPIAELNDIIQHPQPQDDELPPQEDAPPPQKDGPPSQEGALPPQEDGLQQQEDAPPPQDDGPPPQDDVLPRQEDGPPPQEDGPPAVEDAVPPPQVDGLPPQEDGLQQQEDALPPQEDDPPPQEDLPSPQVDGPPPQEDAIPPPHVDGLPPQEDAVPPPQVGGPPPQDDQQPRHHPDQVLLCNDRRRDFIDICFENFDLALRILDIHPLLAANGNALCALARNPSVFNEIKPNFFRRIVNSILCSNVESVESKAMELLRRIWTSIEEKPKHEINGILRGNPVVINGLQTYPSRILFVAAEEGNTKFLAELIRRYPDLIWKQNDDGLSIFHVAVLHLHESIYNLLYEIGSMKGLIIPLKDREKNNMLHLVGKKPEKSKLRGVSGVAFQMQRKLLWFKEVQSMIPPDYRQRKNNDGLTPYQLFTENHKDLVSEAEKWMKGTASKCMVAAALIATVVFAVAYTIPGGYEQIDKQKEGFPVFLHNAPFLVFVVFDAISLILSSTSILMFLSILTSRYAQEDFMKSLPTYLMVGLILLFLSIVTMMISFSVSFFVIYRGKFIPIAIVVSAAALVPIAVYVVLQYPLLKDVYRSTYGSRYLFKPKKRMIYYQNPRV